jgi:hypothetical protein
MVFRTNLCSLMEAETMRALELCRVFHNFASVVFLSVEFLPEDFRECPKHVGNLLYDSTLLCLIIV